MGWWTVFAIVLSAASFTASYVQAKKAQKKAKRLADEMAGVLVNKESNIEAIPVVYGERRVGGVRVFMSTSGDTRHEYLYVALVVSEGEVESISDLEIDEVPATDSRFQGLLSYHYKLGTDDQTTSTVLDDALITEEQIFDDAERDYQGVIVTNQDFVDDFRLRGVAYVAMRLKYDSEVFGGVPDFTVKVKGRKVYDPRQDSTSTYYDSTVGVSTQRASDSSTWEWSDNPAVCLRDYLTNDRFGKGLSASDLDEEQFVQAADDLDSFTVTPYSGASSDIKLFTLNAVIDTNEEIFSNVEKILLACRGYLPYTFGKYGLKIDQASTSVMTLDTSTIVGDINIIGSRKEDRFNQVIVKFPDENTRFQPNNAVWPSPSSDNNTLVSDGQGGYLTESELHDEFLQDDDELLVDEVDLEYCTNFYQARDLARIFLWRSRKSINVALQATSEAMELTVGDVVSITHPTPNWTAKKFQVDEMAINYDGTVTLKCVEYDSNIYTYDPSVEEIEAIDIIRGDTSALLGPTNVSGNNTGSTVLDDGTFHAVLNVSWTAADDATVIEYEVRYKLSASSNYEYLKTTGTSLTVQGMTPGIYNIGVRSINYVGEKSAFVDGSNVDTGVDTSIPGNITNLSFTSGVRAITVEWSNPTDADYAFTEIHVKTSNDLPDYGDLPTAKVAGEEYVYPTGAGVVQRYFFLRAVDRTGNKGNFTGTSNNLGASLQATGDDIGTGEVDTGEIADDAVTVDKIANTLESTNYVAGTSGWRLTTAGDFEAGDGDFRGTVKATVLDVEDANVHGTLTATNIAAGIVTADTLAADVFAEFDDRYGGSGGFYRADNDEFFDGSATKYVTLPTVTHDNSKSIRFQCNLVHAWGTTQGYGGTNGLKVRITFEYSTDDTTYAKVPGSGENSNDYYERSATATIYSVTSAFDLAVDIRHEMTGSSLSDNTAYYFRVKIEYVSATNAFTSAAAGSANGVPIKFNVQQTAGLTASTGDADTVDGLQASQFLRSDTSDTFSGNLTVTGNLTVQGSQTQLDTQTLTVEDNNIVLNYSTGDSSGSADNSGITIQDAVNSSTDASLLWKATGDYFQFSHPINAISSASNAYAAEFRGAPQPQGPSGMVSNGVKITAGSASTDTVLLVQELDNTAILTINGFGQTTFANSVTIDGQSVTGTKIGQWNTAYTYSQVGHLPLAGGTVTGSVIIDSGTAMGLKIEHDSFANALELHREHETNAPAIRFTNNNATTPQIGILFATHADKALVWRDGTSNNAYRLFTDNYHPNADEWTDAIDLTVTLTGDVTGTATESIDGSANKTISITTSYSESDTLDSVTGRGNTTTNDIAVGSVAIGSDTIIGSNTRITAGDGTTSKAGVGFLGSGTTGLSYSSSNDRISFLSGGTVRAWIQTPSSNPIVDAFYIDGSGAINGSVSWTGGSSTNANTAYTYSQVGHLPLAGGTTTGNVTIGGNLVVEDGTISFGDTSGDDHGKLQVYNDLDDRYGFNGEAQYHVLLTNEQGTTNQAMALLDTSPTNSADLWGVSVTTNGSNPTTGDEAGWTKKIWVTGTGIVGAATGFSIGASTVIDSNRKILAALGAEGTPTHTFLDDADTGMYRSGTNSLSFSTGGTKRATVNSSGLQLFDIPLTLNEKITISGSSSHIAMQEDHFVYRRFEMDAVDNDTQVYILLCEYAANNDVNGTITMDRTSGLRHAAVIDVLLSSGNGTPPVGTMRVMGTSGQASGLSYRLVKGTHTDSKVYIAIELNNPDGYHETTGAYFTGRIKTTVSSTELTAVSDLTSKSNFDVQSVHQIGEDEILTAEADTLDSVTDRGATTTNSITINDLTVNDITASGDVILGGSTNIDMAGSATGQLKIQGNGYAGAIALNDDAMHIYHNSSLRDLVLGVNETAIITLKTGQIDTEQPIYASDDLPLAQYHSTTTSAYFGSTGRSNLVLAAINKPKWRDNSSVLHDVVIVDQSQNVILGTISSGAITSSSTVTTGTGSASNPAYGFSADSGNGAFFEWYVQADSKGQVSFATDGARRARVNEAGIWSDANIYLPTSGSLRSFGSFTQITNGAAGGGFKFRNTEDGVDSLVITSAGNGTFAGRVTASDGTLVKAAYGFDSSSTTGISYSSTNNRVNILSGGAVKAYVQTGSSNPVVDTMVVDGSISWSGGGSSEANTAYDQKINSLAFSTSTGVLTATRNDSTTLTVDLDGRYLTSYTETDTLDSVTGRGNATTNAISIGALTGTGSNNVYAATFTGATGPNVTSLGLNVKTLDGANDVALLVEKTDGTDLFKITGQGVGSFSQRISVQSQDITGTRIQNWQTAYGWGDHSTAGYLTAEADTLATVTGRGSTTTNTIGTGSHTISDGKLVVDVAGASSGGQQTFGIELKNTNDTAFTADALQAYNATTGWDQNDRVSWMASSRANDASIFTWMTESNTSVHYDRIVQLRSATDHTQGMRSWIFYHYDGAGTGSGDFQTPVGSLFDIIYRSGASQYTAYRFKHDRLEAPEYRVGTQLVIDSSRNATFANLHVGSTSNLADGTDPSISADSIYASKVVTPKLVFLNDSAGDDNYITCNDANNAYTVNGTESAAWYAFIGDKYTDPLGANNSGAIVASFFKGKEIELSGAMQAGSFGVGVDDPYYKVDVRFNSSDTGLTGGTSGNWGGNGIRVENTNSGVGTLALAHFRTGDSDWHIGNERVGQDEANFVFMHEGSTKVLFDKDGKIESNAFESTVESAEYSLIKQTGQTFTPTASGVTGLAIINNGTAASYSIFEAQTGAGAALDVRNNGDVRVLNNLLINGTTRINSAGNATLGTTTTGALTATSITGTSLSISGAFSIDSLASTGTVSGSQFRASFGDQNDPAYTFKNDDDTGMYGAAGQVKFSVGGSNRMTIGATATTVTGRISVVGDIQAGTVPQTVIDSSRNLTNIGTVSSGAITVNGHIQQNNNNELRGKDTGGSARTLVRVTNGDTMQVGWSGAGDVEFIGGGSYTSRMAIKNTTGNIEINSQLLIANTAASSTPLTLGSSSQTNYTYLGMDTSAHSDEAYLIAYGGAHATQAGDFAMKNLQPSGDIYFELANSIIPLVLSSSGATFSKTSTGSTTQLATFLNPGGNANNGVKLWLSGTNATDRGAYIEAVAESTANNHTLRFGVSASASTPAEVMRLSSTGVTTENSIFIKKGSTSGTFLDFQKSDGTVVGRINYTAGDNLAIYGTATDHAGLNFIGNAVIPVSGGSEANDAIALGDGTRNWSSVFTQELFVGSTNVLNDARRIRNITRLGLNTTDPEVVLDVVNGDLGSITNRNSTYTMAVFEAEDAHIDVLSSSAGTWGSSINLRETHSGAFRNSWSISRKTGTAPDLNFNFGTANDHNVGNIKVVFSSTGDITATTAEFSTALDRALTVASTDATTGIQFTDNSDTAYFYYRGNDDRFYTTSAQFSVNGDTLASGYNFQVNGAANITGGARISGPLTLAGSTSQINMQEDHYVFRSFQVDAVDNNTTFYILLCEFAGNNDVNGTITMDRTSGLRHACSLDILISAGSSATPVGTMRSMGVTGGSTPSYNLVKGTHTDNKVYIAVKVYNPDNYHETSGAYFTGRIKTTVSSNEFAVVTSLTSESDFDLNGSHEINGSDIMTGSEADTLDSVTDRGATTTNDITVGRVIGTAANGSNLYALTLTRSGTGTATPDLMGSNDTLVLGTSSSVKAVSFATDGADFAGALSSGGTTILSSTRRFYASSGTSAKAAYSFDGDSGTGISRTASGRLDFLSTGVVKAYIQTGSSNPISPTMYVDGYTQITGDLDVDADLAVGGDITASGNTVFAEIGKFDGAGTTPASCKLHVGAINNTTSSAIAQFGGFIRVGGSVIIHDGPAASRQNHIEFEGTDITFRTISGDATGVIKTNGYKIGTTTTPVITSSRDFNGVNANFSGNINLNTAGQKINLGATTGTVAYIRHGDADNNTGSVSIGSDNRIDFIESDNDTLAFKFETNTGNFLCTGNTEVEGNLIVHCGNNAGSTAKIRSIGQAGDPCLEFSDNGGDQHWAIGADDRDVGYFTVRFNGSTAFPNDWTSNGSMCFEINGGSTNKDIVFNGNVTAYSDIRIKENIEQIPDALSKVHAIRGITYDRIDSDDGRRTGVIAQEVEAVLPEVVRESKDGIKSVDYGNMVGLLIEALKEADEKIELLTKRIEELENGNH